MCMATTFSQSVQDRKSHLVRGSYCGSESASDIVRTPHWCLYKRSGGFKSNQQWHSQNSLQMGVQEVVTIQDKRTSQPLCYCCCRLIPVFTHLLNAFLKDHTACFCCCITIKGSLRKKGRGGLIVVFFTFSLYKVMGKVKMRQHTCILVHV